MPEDHPEPQYEYVVPSREYTIHEGDQVYRVTTPPAIQAAGTISRQLAHEQMASFLEDPGFEVNEILHSVVLIFIHVAHVRGCHIEDGEEDSCWVVGGNIPYVRLSDEEIKTPIEALAIYAYLMDQWTAFKGKSTEECMVADYRLSPDWRELEYGPGIHEFHVGIALNMICFGWLERNRNHLKFDEIREMCIDRGWIKKDPPGDTPAS